MRYLEIINKVDVRDKVTCANDFAVIEILSTKNDAIVA